MKKKFITGSMLAAQMIAAKKEHKPHSFDGEVNSGTKLIAVIIAMGDDYDPANTKITKANIILKQEEITTMNNAAKDANSSEKQMLIDRTGSFEMIDTVATNSLNVLKSSENVEEAQVVIASHLVTKVRGGRIIPIKVVPPAEETPHVEEGLTVDTGDAELNAIRRNSVSFQKMGIKLGNLFTLLSYLKSLSCYQTNNAQLTIDALMAFYENLMLLNSTAENAIAVTNTAREARNESFFNNTTGARFLYSQVKKYIATTLGIKSPNYKLVKCLPFPNLIKKKLRTATTNF